MKRAKRMYLLLGVLVVVCAAAFGVAHYEKEKELIETSGSTILELDSGSVTELSWEYEDETLSFHKEDTWLYDDDSAFPVDEEQINSLLELFQDFRAAFIIQEVTDYGQYGLNDPTCTIHITADETEYEILLGDYSTMDSQRYVSIGDGNVYLAQTDPLDYYDATLSDLIAHDEIPAFDQVERLQVAGVDSYEAVYLEDSGYSYCSDDVYFKQQDDSYLPLDTQRVDDYLSSLSALNPTNYVTYNASDSDLATYGLDNPELTVTISYTAEEEDGGEATSDVFTISVSRDPDERSAVEEDAAPEEDEEEEITAYVRIGQSKIIYQIDGSDYETLMATSYNDLRHQEVFTASFDDVTGFDVTLEDTTYQITSDGKGDSKTFYYGEEELDLEDFTDALESLAASSFTDENPTEKEEIALTIYLDNESYPTIEIQLYRYDGTHCLAVLDGQPLSLVPRSSVVELIEAVNTIVL